MKVNFDLKNKCPSVEFCYNNKCIIIRYWGGLKFDKVVFYDSQQKNSYSVEDLKEAFKQSRQAYIFEKDMPPIYESFEDWFEQFKNK
jgi:hypothetical protein